MNLLHNFHLAVIEYLYRGHCAVSLQTFTTRHSNRKLSIVMALSTTFTQCAPETTKFGKIAQNKDHFTFQGHLRSPLLVPIESSYTTSYQWLILACRFDTIPACDTQTHRQTHKHTDRRTHDDGHHPRIASAARVKIITLLWFSAVFDLSPLTLCINYSF